MSLKAIFEILSGFFQREKMDYGIIGAFALFSYGYSRATQEQGKTAMKNDLDFKWDKREQDFVEQRINIHEQQVEKRDAEEYLNFLSGIGQENLISPIPRIRDKQFVL